MTTTVAFVGLTHLGLISAAASLVKDVRIIAFDPNLQLVENLKIKKYPISEPKFEETIEKYKDNIRFTSHSEDIAGADIVYVAPDIPTDDFGHSDLSVIQNLVNVITPYLSKIGCLVILSQVPPSFTRTLSKKLEKENFDTDKLYYQVETLVFGIAMDRALYPERYIVGLKDPEKPLYTKYEEFLKSFGCPILPMRYESAEFCKICINAFLAANVTTSNVLEEICQGIEAKWSEISPALRLDKRIGQYAYLSPGLGISGGNIERDLKTILTLSHKKGTESSVIESFIKSSSYRKDWPLRIFHKEVLPQLKKGENHIGVLGLSYKENTHSIKNSPSIRLLSQLKGFSICAYDPKVKTIPSSLETNVVCKSSIKEVLSESNVLFLMTPWLEFKELSRHDIISEKCIKFIIDPYGLLKGLAPLDFVEYYSFC